MGSGSRFGRTATLFASAWLAAARPSPAEPEAGAWSQPAVTDLAASVHSDLACTSCHGEEGMGADAERACGTCHAAAASALASGRHSGTSPPLRPGCVTCHGSHRVLAVANPASSAHFARVPGTCAACHEREAVEYGRGVHAAGVLTRRDPHGATCTSCHEAHATGSSRDASAWSSPAHLSRTCGACHPGQASAYAGSAHEAAVASGDRDAPTCASCHGSHEVLAVGDALSPVARVRSATVTCAPCHGAVRLEGRHLGRVDVVHDFDASYHGLALAAGDLRVANCASCHGAHAVRAASDPDSSVHPANLDRTCGACHPGAVEGFARGGVHHVPAGGHRLADGVRWLYLMMIPMVVGGMVVHDVLDFRRRWRERRGRATPPDPPGARVEHLRFTSLERAQHWTVAVSFILLAASGFAMVFGWGPFGADPVTWERARALVHRSAAALFLAVVAFHVGWVIASRRGRAFLRDMVPRLRGPKDVLCRVACCFRLGPPSTNDWHDLVQVLRAGLGLPHERPRSGRFTYAERMEYFALAWGGAVMAITGLALWFEVPVLNRLPYWTIHVATTVHYFEAVLAVLSIVAWHFYFTMFNPDVFPLSKVMFTGRMSDEEMLREHPAALEAGAGETNGGTNGDERTPGAATPKEKR